MRYEPVEGLEPTVLRWARESLGLSVAQVAAKMKRKQEDIELWESGQAAPTYPQLEKLAYTVYKRPVAVFFLPHPPDEPKPIQKFRTLPDTDMRELRPDTYLQIRRAEAFRQSMRDFFVNGNPSTTCLWNVVNLDIQQPTEIQVARVREALGVPLEQQILWHSDGTALNEWRGALERVGVFVFKAPFKQRDISGFCLLDDSFPVIYLNNSTTKTRQIFSLFHEVAHLLLGMNGISKFDNPYEIGAASHDSKIEVFCNRFAADFLIPLDDFRQRTAHMSRNIEAVPEEEFSRLAATYGVSREAILRRLSTIVKVDPVYYQAMAKKWDSQRRKKNPGGDWFESNASYLSHSFAGEVLRRFSREELSAEQVSELLGIKAANVPGLEEKMIQRMAL